MSFSVESSDLQELSSSENEAPGKGECPHSLWFPPKHLLKLQTLGGSPSSAETQLKNVLKNFEKLDQREN